MAGLIHQQKGSAEHDPLRSSTRRSDFLPSQFFAETPRPSCTASDTGSEISFLWTAGMTDLAGDESDSTSPSKRKEKRSSRRWSQSCGQSCGSWVGARPCRRDTRADELGIFVLRAAAPPRCKRRIEEEVDRISVG